MANKPPVTNKHRRIDLIESETVLIKVFVTNLQEVY